MPVTADESYLQSKNEKESIDMNLIYIHTHDTGKYIQPYGYPVTTPNLMQFASRGTLFRHAFSAAPTCAPSRASLMTGMCPHSNGMLGLPHRGFLLNDYSKHMAQYLQNFGFETILCGEHHEAPDDDMIGYSQILSRDKSTKEISEKAWDLTNADRVADFLLSGTEKPFFLSFGMHNTHREYPEIDKDINPDFVMPPFPVYDTKETRKDMAAFYSSVKIVDSCVGTVLDALKKSGHDKDTAVIISTDHGIAFPRMKCHLYDTGIGVMLMIDFPGNPMNGKVLDALVSQIDLFPTVCDLLGISKPFWLQGHTLMPLLNGTEREIRNEIFAEVNFHAAYEPKRCVRTSRYKLIRLYDNHNHIVPANTDDSPSKDFLLRCGYLTEVKPREMLFDLNLDPIERINLVMDNRYADIYSEMCNRLDQWMKQTNDPILKGKLQKPEHAKVNKLSCISPASTNYEK